MSLHLRSIRRVVAGLTFLGLLVPAAASAQPQATAAKARKFTIYGHRGAAGYRPEHTIGSYTLAARLGVSRVVAVGAPARVIRVAAA